jgi:glycosyltransferase involved in cell wall biosynthesis
MKRVLFITKFAPTGRPFGGMVRTTRLLGALRERFDVEVLGFVEEGDPAPRGRVSTALTSFRTGRPYQTVRYDTAWLRAQIADRLATFRPDALHVDYLHQAPAVWDVPLRKALDLHNVESLLSAGIAASSSGLTKLMAGRDARLLRAVEQRAAAAYDLVTAPSAKEAARMPGDVEVVVNGVDPARLPLDVAPDPNLACFVGIFSWAPNIDGAEWLVQRVVPLLPEPMRVALVGRNPHRRVQALAGPRVTVTGEVPDTWPYVSNASVVLAPLLAPGGTRHKILEGLLAERPVVATPEAADGLEDLAGEGLVLAPDAEAFAAEVVALAHDRERAAQLGKAGRRAVVERYSWDASCRKLLTLYEDRLGLT